MNLACFQKIKHASQPYPARISQPKLPWSRRRTNSRARILSETMVPARSCRRSPQCNRLRFWKGIWNLYGYMSVTSLLTFKIVDQGLPIPLYKMVVCDMSQTKGAIEWASPTMGMKNGRSSNAFSLRHHHSLELDLKIFKAKNYTHLYTNIHNLITFNII